MLEMKIIFAELKFAKKKLYRQGTICCFFPYFSTKKKNRPNLVQKLKRVGRNFL